MGLNAMVSALGGLKAPWVHASEWLEEPLNNLCVCIYVCVYICIYVYMYICIRMCISIYTYMRVCVCMCTCINVWHPRTPGIIGGTLKHLYIMVKRNITWISQIWPCGLHPWHQSSSLKVIPIVMKRYHGDTHELPSWYLGNSMVSLEYHSELP